jgi:hypothetical protein
MPTRTWGNCFWRLWRHFFCWLKKERFCVRQNYGFRRPVGKSAIKLYPVSPIEYLSVRLLLRCCSILILREMLTTKHSKCLEAATVSHIYGCGWFKPMTLVSISHWILLIFTLQFLCKFIISNSIQIVNVKFLHKGKFVPMYSIKLNGGVEIQAQDFSASTLYGFKCPA